MRKAELLCMLALLLMPASLAFAQTGKIAGRVVDAGSGDPLPGVNVVIEGTTQGATTDIDGYYNLLNVRPGTHAVRASFIGYTPQITTDVRVNIDLTTELDFALEEETVGLDEVVVSAQRPVVQRDVSASVANLSAQEIENLPVTDVAEVIGLQAGFERGLQVRGSGGDQVSFRVDGLNLSLGRSNTPFTGISYTAVDEVQVQTGGFSAEYGNVRSGLINVVTKEGNRSRYTADIIVRFAPGQEKNFEGFDIDGNPVLYPNSEHSYFMRPFYDPAVAFNGTTSGGWDIYQQRNYQTFEGWNVLAEGSQATPEQLQEAYAWYVRKDFEITEPDYEVDGTIGGPVPLISRYLGDLRFTTSLRRTQNMFFRPLIRDRFEEQTWQGKLTSDIASGIKLNVFGMYAQQKSIHPTEMDENVSNPDQMLNGDMPDFPWDYADWYFVSRIGDGETTFADHFRNPMDVTLSMVGAQFTHALSSNTFYEVQLQRSATDYLTSAGIGEERSTEILRRVGPIELTEEPFGWEWRDTYDKLGVGIRNGGHWFSARDSSTVSRWTGRFDLTSQLNRFMQVKTGVEYIYNDYDINFAEVDPAHPHHANPERKWNRTPVQGALYGQTKLEFQGMVANIGLRMDYFNAGGEWYVFETFERAFTAADGGADELPENLESESTEHLFSLSPRLGVSFPITERSKLYFNYGHFRNQLNPLSLFTIQEINTGRVRTIGNPNHPMPRTVAYELGYEQSLAEMYHIRLAAYYRDLQLQPRGVHFISIDSEVDYFRDAPLNYSDHRGIELTVSKNRGDWIRGWINFTYRASKFGNFGFGTYYQNPVSMREHVRTTTEHYQSRPIPEPFARMNLELVVPEGFGPDLAGANLLGDWRINLLGEWRDGQPLTFNGLSLAGGSTGREIANNTSWRDYWNFDLRLAKNFNAVGGDAQFFIDVTNVFNLRHMYRTANPFYGDRDEEYYLRSLHWPKDTFEGLETGDPYRIIYGNDQPGDFRKPGAPFTPIEIVDALPETGNSRALYYVWEGEDGQSGKYYRFEGGSFTEASSDFVDTVLKEKRYIDMPNAAFRTFLNPRSVHFGLRLSF